MRGRVKSIVIGAGPLTVEDVAAVADGAGVTLHPDAIARIRAGRAVVEAALATGAPIYGLTTGVGHMKDVRLPDDELRSAQEALLRTHAGGLGAPEPTEIVRAAMAVRLNGLCRGGAGASLAVAETLAAMLCAGVHPVVPRHGSVGAADLAQMAAIGLVAIGEGRAELGGDVLPGGEALRRAGVAPLVVGPKDGLALVSANGISIGHGALVVLRAAGLAAAADDAAALSMEAIRGNPSMLATVVGEAKPYPGQIETLRHLQAALAGSDLLEPGGPASLQDPLSFRVVPQVHGALREFIAGARHAVEVELDSMSDNPLVSVADGTMVHNGNFHPIVLAIAFDALRIALAHVGQLSERRIGHLWDAFFAGSADEGGWRPGGTRDYFGLWLRYGAASQVAELKQLAAPATLDVPPLDMEIEDHATGAPLTVAKTGAALDLLENILAIELLIARDVVSLSRDWIRLGVLTEALLRALDQTVAGVGDDRSPAAVHELVRRQVVHRSRT